MEYSYDSGNKLTKVKDYGSGDYGFKDGTNTGNDYDYDANGNMIQDLNKGIGTNGITYNHLNLPTTVTINGQNITYIYDDVGTKLKKTVQGVSTEYAGNYIYENGSLKFFSTAEGYYNVTSPPSGELEGAYVYQYKDHLGNIRLSYTDADGNGTINPNTEIVKESNYYPFGLKHKGYNNNVSANANSVASKFKYNGVEHEEALGLNLYEMDFRQYDPTIARWTGIDPVTHHSQSTYNGFNNNPIYFPDPSGALSPLELHNNGLDPYPMSGLSSFGFAGDAGSGETNCCPGSGTDSDPYVLEPVEVSAPSKWTSEVTSDYSRSLPQWKEQYGYEGTDQEVLNQYKQEYGNSYKSPSVNIWEGVDMPAFVANWNAGALNWREGEAGHDWMMITSTMLSMAFSAAGPSYGSAFGVTRARVAISSTKAFTYVDDIILYSQPIYKGLRAPAGGIRIGGTFYKGGRFIPSPRINFGRGAIPNFSTLSPLSSPLRPTPLNYHRLSTTARWLTGLGGSGAAGYYYYQQTLK